MAASWFKHQKVPAHCFLFTTVSNEFSHSDFDTNCRILLNSFSSCPCTELWPGVWIYVHGSKCRHKYYIDIDGLKRGMNITPVEYLPISVRETFRRFRSVESFTPKSFFLLSFTSFFFCVFRQKCASINFLSDFSVRLLPFHKFLTLLLIVVSLEIAEYLRWYWWHWLWNSGIYP
jgi:hypothetical protein